MKLIKLLTSVAFCLVLLPNHVSAAVTATDSVPPVHLNFILMSGEWSDIGPRSLPIPPAAFVEGNEVTVSFTEALTNVTILVTDLDGVTLYQETISPPSDADYKIPYWFDEGEYLLTLRHFKGKLSGSFTVE